MQTKNKNDLNEKENHDEVNEALQELIDSLDYKRGCII